MNPRRAGTAIRTSSHVDSKPIFKIKKHVSCWYKSSIHQETVTILNCNAPNYTISK